jgi:vanillate O-demethylase ferredoxin subunit
MLSSRMILGPNWQDRRNIRPRTCEGWEEPPSMNVADLIEVRVRSLRWECRDVLRIELEPTGGLLPKPEAGAHLDLHLDDGAQRQYSLTIGSSPERYILGVRREVRSRGGSAAIHDRLRPGQILNVSQPRNTFALAPEGAVHLIGGGIGVTPLLLMAHELIQAQREWSLTHCVRSREDAPFLQEVAEIGGRLHVDQEDGLPDLDAMLADIAADAHVYCCGPGPMLDRFVDACASRPKDRVHIERFEPAALTAGEGEFVVELARSGKQLVVPSDKTILDVLLAEGVPQEHSCRVGVCGTCETKVLAGQPDHRDLVLTDEEREDGLMMICCSRAQGDRLVLDI